MLRLGQVGILHVYKPQHIAEAHSRCLFLTKHLCFACISTVEGVRAENGAIHKRAWMLMAVRGSNVPGW